MLHQHCTNFFDTAHQKSQTNIEQKEKIVWNNKTCYLEFYQVAGFLMDFRFIPHNNNAK